MKTPCLITLALATVLAGCAGSQWAKAGADPAAIARDQAECREVALARGVPRVAPAMSPQGLGQTGTLGGPAAGSGNARVIEEHEDVRQCMLKRGYRLERTH